MILLSKKSVFYIGVILIVALFVLSNFAAGERIEDKLSRVIKLELGLDSDIYRVVETEYQGEKVVLVVIFGNEKAQKSSLGNDIKAGLREYQGKSPVAISVLTRDKEAKFQPYALRVIQNGQTTQVNRVIGITDGFKDGNMPEKVPIDGKVFWGSKGIITLGSSFNPTTPFKIKYGTRSVSFTLASQPKESPQTAEVKQKNKEESRSLMGGESEIETGKESQEKDLKSPISSSKSKSGQGLALLAQFGTLLAITLSFL